MAGSSTQSKEGQRAELHKTIWRIANDLRGSVDGWDFKSYVLGMLFYRFISENLTAYINEGERKAGSEDFDYAQLSDSEAEFGRKETVAEKGFYILPSELFANVRKRASADENLNETLERVFRNIEGSAVGTDSEDDLKGLFDDLDVNSGRLGQTVAKRNEKLVKLLNATGDLDLGAEFTEHTIDAFGDAYEYLMTMYASGAGKSGGEFFTPQEVSELLARITVVGRTAVNKVYDPACGSGSLLLKFAKVLGKDNVRQGFFGQEINLTTYNLARINMFLHDVNYEKFDLAHGDTLIDPMHWDDEPFEAIVSNPPYSTKWEGDANPLLINDPRYAPAGVLAPKSKADLAFTMHMLSWLAVNGTAAIVEFPGVLYRSGTEQKIRKYLVDNNYVDTVIQLPADLFFGTTIATCILVLKKSKTTNDVLFIDASAEFVHPGNKNKLSEANQQKILEAFEARADVAHFSRVIANSEIAEHDYKLVVSSFVEAEDTHVAIDLAEVDAEISRTVRRQAELRSRIDSIDARIGEASTADAKIKPLGEVGVFIRGNGLPKSALAETGFPAIHYGQIHTHYGISAERTKSFTDPALAAKLRRAEPGDLIVATTSEDDAAVAKATAWLGPQEVAVSGDAYIFRHSLDPLYAAYYFQTRAFQKQKQRYITGTKVRRVSGDSLSRIQIPVPPIEVQREIAHLLEQLRELRAELETELRAELTERGRQFEYHLDSLLSFEEGQK